MYGEKVRRKKRSSAFQTEIFHEPNDYITKLNGCVLLLMAHALKAREGNRIDCNAS